MAASDNPDSGGRPAPEAPDPVLPGDLHLYVAFDWGDEIDLERARRLVPAEVHVFPRRRRRTPSSIAYRPPPLRFRLAPVALTLPEIGTVQAAAEATVFDFAAVSVALELPFRLTKAEIARLAGGLAEPAFLVEAARKAVQPLHGKLLPAVQNPLWKDDLSEEYVVFWLSPQASVEFQKEGTVESPWLAGLVRLENQALSPEEITEALRLRIRYGPADLFVPDWAAAVLFDDECEETLQTIEFANLQLLELRHIDERLDGSLTAAYNLIHGLVRTRLPFWRSHARPLRVLGELRVEAHELFERTENVLKLVGDQYLARVYRLLATRFHLEEWGHAIRRKLEVIEGVYGVVADQASHFRTEFLEVIVIVLILTEIVLALFRH